MRRFSKLFSFGLVMVMLFAMSIQSFAAPVAMSDGNYFDAEYYAAANPDAVQMMGSGDAASMYAHYINIGKNQGRLPYADANTRLMKYIGNGILFSSDRVIPEYFTPYYKGSIEILDIAMNKGPSPYYACFVTVKYRLKESGQPGFDMQTAIDLKCYDAQGFELSYDILIARKMDAGRVLTRQVMVPYGTVLIAGDQEPY